MNQSNVPAKDEGPEPYGTEPRRSFGPVVLWALLLTGWVGALAWMAAHVGPKA